MPDNKIVPVRRGAYHVHFGKSHVYINHSDIRRVWAAVSVDPDARLNTLAVSTFMNRKKVRACLLFLSECGYIKYYPRPHVVVSIPFVEENRIEYNGVLEKGGTDGTGFS